MNGDLNHCHHCGSFHQGGCPRVKAIEYYPDGTVRRVEYRVVEDLIRINPAEVVGLAEPDLEIYRECRE